MYIWVDIMVSWYPDIMILWYHDTLLSGYLTCHNLHFIIGLDRCICFSCAMMAAPCAYIANCFRNGENIEFDRVCEFSHAGLWKLLAKIMFRCGIFVRNRNCNFRHVLSRLETTNLDEVFRVDSWYHATSRYRVYLAWISYRLAWFSHICKRYDIC